jgi:hypothetical protein
LPSIPGMRYPGEIAALGFPVVGLDQMAASVRCALSGEERRRPR